MSNRKKLVFLVFLSIISCIHINAQENGTYGAYSPYSIFGIGDISKEGTAYNKSMGGVGLASRNKRFINYLNPAAIAVRDSCSFMADFGLQQQNKVYRQNDIRSGSNTFNIYDFVMSFPIYRSSALVVGICPFSDLGYDIKLKETDPDIIGNTGNITYDTYGEGSVYQLFLGAGATFWKRFSVGANLIYYFGNIDKVYNVNYANQSHGSINSGYDLQVRGVTGKFGLQYQQPLGKDLALVFGATYRLGTKMKGRTIYYENKVTSSVVDTLVYNEMKNGRDNKIRIGDEVGVGVSLRQGDKWSVEFNYIRSHWKGTGIDKYEGYGINGVSDFSATASQSFRAGFEVVPNRNDIRYYMRTCAYRAGVYYDQAYYKLDGNKVNSVGITLGMTFPVFRWYNGISIGVDFGQRGSLRGNMVRERYVNFVVGFNIFDIWFQRPRYN